MQKITTELQTKFQTKNRTFFLLKCIFDKALHTSFILQRCGKTSSHQRCSQSLQNIFSNVLQNSCFQKIFKIHRKTPVFESLFDKVTSIKREPITSVFL